MGLKREVDFALNSSSNKNPTLSEQFQKCREKFVAGEKIDAPINT
jgi:hypothetical protein